MLNELLTQVQSRGQGKLATQAQSSCGNTPCIKLSCPKSVRTDSRKLTTAAVNHRMLADHDSRKEAARAGVLKHGSSLLAVCGMYLGSAECACNAIAGSCGHLPHP